MSAPQPLIECANYTRGDCKTNGCTAPCDHCRAPQPLTGDELATIKARAEADQCGGLWLDHAEPVCGVHGFYWQEDSEWCNRVEPAARETLRLVAEIERLRAQVERVEALAAVSDDDQWWCEDASEYAVVLSDLRAALNG